MTHVYTRERHENKNTRFWATYAPMGHLIKIGTFLNKGRFLWHKPRVCVTF